MNSQAESRRLNRTGKRKVRRCVECEEFEKHENYGFCKAFGWEFSIQLAKKQKVCSGVE